MTPATVHHGRAEALHADRALDAAYTAIPERSSATRRDHPALPTAAWINKPNDKQAAAH